jgi:hypothetical protein
MLAALAMSAAFVLPLLWETKVTRTEVKNIILLNATHSIEVTNQPSIRVSAKTWSTYV